MFMATYTAEHAGSRIAFASTVPGEIYALDVGATGGMICQKGAFLCAEETVNLNVTFSKKLSAGMFGGEGFVLQDISGTGMAFLEVDGDLVCRYLHLFFLTRYSRTLTNYIHIFSCFFIVSQQMARLCSQQIGFS